MHDGSQTCLSGHASHSGDGRCVVPNDMMMDSTKQRGAGLRSLTRESLTSTVEMLTHSLRQRPPDAMAFRNRDSVLIGRGVWDCRPRGNSAEVITQHIGQNHGHNSGLSQLGETSAFDAREMFPNGIDFPDTRSTSQEFLRGPLLVS